MSKRSIKVFALCLSAAMLCTNIPMDVFAQTKENVQNVAAQGVFDAVFVNEYAKVGEPLVVNATGGENYTYQWYVDGVKIANHTNSYTPVMNDIEKWITVNVTSGSNTVERSIYCSKLPVIYIDTENQAPIVSKEEYVSGTMRIQGNETFNKETTTLYDGEIEIKGRGNSTWGMPKKPYKVKLDKKTNIMDMGKSKHWVLLANYSDTSLMRNTLSYNFSGQLGMPQMETTWVDLILNGKYVGNYQFCEQIKIDKKRVDVFDWESLAEDAAEAIADAEGITDAKGLEDAMVENMAWTTTKKVTFEGKTYQVDHYVEIPGITGGYLMELDEHYDEVSKFRTEDGQPIMFKSPEFVNTNKDMMNYVQEYIQAFENAVKANNYSSTYKGQQKHYSELFDFDALVDYWLINEIFYNEELNKKSTYLYKDIDGLVKMGPIWDMDYSSGGEGYTYVTNQWATNAFNINAQSKNWYKSLIKDPYFVLKAQERYWEIRDTYVEDMVKENGAIDTNFELLKESGKVNAEMWPYKGHDFVKGTKVLKDWMKKHLVWLDQQFDTETSIINSLGSYHSSNMQLTLTDKYGAALPKDTINEKAKADAQVYEEEDVVLHIQANNASAKKAEIYVNSQPVKEVSLGNGKADVKVSGQQLSAQANEKDVIEVKLTDGYDKVLGTNYVSIVEKEAAVLGIEVIEPEKKEYYAGEEFDAAGLIVYALKENGTRTDVTSDAVVEGYTGIIGENTITVSYGGFSKTFTVIVKERTDKKALETAISNANALDESLYTEASWSDLAKALENAETVFADAEATQEEVDEATDCLLIAIANLEKSVYTVTVNGEVFTTGTYNERVTVTAPTVEGKTFTAWLYDGKVISTEETYTFFLSDDIDLTASYEAVEIKAEALLTNTILTKRDTKADIKFVAQLVVPTGYTVKDAGLVWSSKEGTELSLENKNLKPTYITRISNTEQFSVTIKGMPAGRFIRGKIFATLVDGEGNESIVYSDEARVVNK